MGDGVLKRPGVVEIEYIERKTGTRAIAEHLASHGSWSTLGSLSSLPRSLTCHLKGSSPRFSAASSDGPSNRPKMRMAGSIQFDLG